jgi:DNA-binding beta-propeller fold protein YncE
VVSESGDRVTWLRPGAGTLVIEKVVPVGLMPTDVDGPHHVAMAPDGKSYFVSIAHGQPFGTLWRIAIDGDTLIGRASLEMFPTTISLTPDGELAFVANSDFHGDHRGRTWSRWCTWSMNTITHIPAATAARGRTNHAGTVAYVTRV